MSQRAVEGLLGRLITDKAFRHKFYEEPVASCAQESLEVTQRELEALLRLDELHLEQFAKRLDPKIVRATVEVNALSRRVRSVAEAEAAPVGVAK